MEIRGDERREHLGTGTGFHPCEGRDHRREIEYVGKNRRLRVRDLLLLGKKEISSSQKQSWKEVHYERPDRLLTEQRKDSG